MTEASTEQFLREHLSSKGLNVKERKGIRGIDIQATGTGKEYFIEVQGNQKPNGKPFSENQKYTHWNRAIGQICLRMDDGKPSDLYAIGIPHGDAYYDEMIANTKRARRLLGLTVFKVKDDGTVIVVNP